MTKSSTLDFDRPFPVLQRYAYYLTKNRDRALDLYQDTVLKMWEYRHSFDGRHPEAWGITIMRHRFFDLAKKSKRQVESPQSMITDQQAALELSDILRFIPTLSQQHQVVMRLSILGHTPVEISSIINCPQVTVRTRLLRIRDKLKQAGL